MNLLESTQKLLQSRLDQGASLRDIAKESEGAVQFEWLRKFHEAEEKNPTVRRLQSLHDFLAKKKRKRAA